MRNEVTMSGVIIRTNDIYEILCLRESGTIDRVKLIGNVEMGEYEGLNVTVIGHIIAKRGLDLLVDVYYIHETTDIALNYVELTGHICKMSNIRAAKNGKQVRTIILATGDNNYIPVLIWNKHLRSHTDLNIGDVLSLEGRLQSREFEKRVLDTYISKTTYEVTAMNIT